VSEGDWFAALMVFSKDYATMIAASPVLLAIIVAKQQIDENHHQHVATIKYSLRKEIDSLERIKSFNNSVVKACSRGNVRSFSQRGFMGIPIQLPSEDDVQQLRALFDNDLWIYVEICRRAAESAINFQVSDDDDGGDCVEAAQLAANRLQEQVRIEEARLTQYWS